MLRSIFDDATDALDTALKLAGAAPAASALGEEFIQHPPPSLPFIVWVPDRGPMSGKREAIDKTREGTPANQNPDPIFQRNLKIDAYIYTEVQASNTSQAEEGQATADPDPRDSYDVTEELMEHFIAACQTALAGRFEPMGEAWSMGWPAGTAEPTNQIPSGTLVIVTFEVKLALTREKTPDVTGATQSTTMEIDL